VGINENDDLLFFSLLPDIKSLPQWWKHRLRLKFHEFIINEVEEAERQLARISNISDIPEQKSSQLKQPSHQYIPIFNMHTHCEYLQQKGTKMKLKFPCK
jgi:hypothetical protein